MDIESCKNIYLNCWTASSATFETISNRECFSYLWAMAQSELICSLSALENVLKTWVSAVLMTMVSCPLWSQDHKQSRLSGSWAPLVVAEDELERTVWPCPGCKMDLRHSQHGRQEPVPWIWCEQPPAASASQLKTIQTQNEEGRMSGTINWKGPPCMI